MSASREFVTVANCRSVLEAEQLRSVLEASGIVAFVSDSNLLTTDPFLGPALGGVGVLVRSPDAERALSLVREHEAETRREATSEEEDALSETVCIACGAEFPEYLERCPACGLSYS